MAAGLSASESDELGISSADSVAGDDDSDAAAVAAAAAAKGGASASRQGGPDAGGGGKAPKGASSSTSKARRAAAEDLARAREADAAEAARAAEEAELLEYGRSLGVDLEGEDADLRWVVTEAFAAPLPPSWTEHMDEEGRVYFYNHMSQESGWLHPMDCVYKEVLELAKALRAESADAAAASSGGGSGSATSAAAKAARKVEAVQAHLEASHAKALELLEGWSGPYSSEAGQQYFYHAGRDISSWENPVDERQEELAMRQRILHRCVLLNGLHASGGGGGASLVDFGCAAGGVPGAPGASSVFLPPAAAVGSGLDSDGLLPALPRLPLGLAPPGGPGGGGGEAGGAPKSPSSTRSFATARSGRSARSARSTARSPRLGPAPTLPDGGAAAVAVDGSPRVVLAAAAAAKASAAERLAAVGEGGGGAPPPTSTLPAPSSAAAAAAGVAEGDNPRAAGAAVAKELSAQRKPRSRAPSGCSQGGEDALEFTFGTSASVALPKFGA